MSLTLAAVGAIASALLELSVVPYLKIAGAEPDLVLVFAVIWTVAAGIEGGLTWAFFGGLMIDILAARPFGSTAFALLVSVGGAAAFGRLMPGGRHVVPVLAVFVFSFVNQLMFLLVYSALKGPVPVVDPLGAIVPGSVYNTVIATALVPLIVALRVRYGESERVDW